MEFSIAITPPLLLFIASNFTTLESRTQITLTVAKKTRAASW